jgi:ABC-type amino acid transport substrate-binding protein
VSWHRWQARWLLLGVVLVGCTAEASRPLRVCLEANSAPFSTDSGPRHGLDYDVAALVAEALRRPLAVHWFSASADDDFPAPLQANWLLSRGACQLIGGYPLARDGLGAAPVTELPPSESGGPPVGVRLHTLAASLPYLSLPLTLISALGDTPVARLDAVAGRRLAVERESLADAIALVYGGGQLQRRIQRLRFDGDAIFQLLETRAADFAFIEQHRFEVYRSRVPTTRLRETGYRHVLAVNTGFAGIAPALLHEVDRALQRLMTAGRIAAIVEAYGLSYTVPGTPAVLPPLTPRLLARREAAHHP